MIVNAQMVPPRSGRSVGGGTSCAIETGVSSAFFLSTGCETSQATTQTIFCQGLSLCPQFPPMLRQCYEIIRHVRLQGFSEVLGPNRPQGPPGASTAPGTTTQGVGTVYEVRVGIEDLGFRGQDLWCRAWGVRGTAFCCQ